MSISIWVVIGTLLLISELFTGTLAMVFFGLAALCVALIADHTSLGTQLLVFAGACVVIVFFARHRLKAIFVGDSKSNDGAANNFIGKIAIAQDTLPDGRVLVTLNGVNWQAIVPGDVSPGSKIKVTGQNGINLTGEVIQ